MSSVWTSWMEVLDSSRFFCLSVRVCFTPWTYCPQGILARVAFDEKAFLEPCRGKITHRHSILSLALRKNDVLILSTSFFSAIGKSTSCRSPCMDFLPPSGGVFRLSLTGSSPGIPCRRSCGFQGAMLERQQKSRHKTDRSCLRFFGRSCQSVMWRLEKSKRGVAQPRRY